MILTYKYRIKDRSAKKTLRRHAYAVNQVWNYCCAQQLDVQARYRAGEKPRKWATHYDLQKLCKGVSKILNLNQQSVGEVCRQFAVARDKIKRAPNFRSSFGAKRSLGWIPFQNQGRQIEGNTITYFRKRYRFWEGGRPLPENAKGGYFVEDSLGRWYVCFHVEVEQRIGGDAAIGIDLGLKSFVTLSDGRRIGAPQYYRQYEQRIAKSQRANNQRKSRRLWIKIQNCRQDFLHKLSTELAARYSLIVVGNVNAKQLAQTRMAKSVLDASWSTFRTMLKYKSVGYEEVNESFTTVTCSACGARSGPKGQKGLRIREWICDECGAVHDRDHNSAKNILARSAAGPVEGSRGRVAQ